MQTQNSETKSRGMGVKHHGVCVQCSKQTQNSETKNRGVGVEHGGVRGECSKQTQNSRTNQKVGNKKSWCVCGMFETNPKLENKPKTRKQKIVVWALSIGACGMFETN